MSPIMEKEKECSSVAQENRGETIVMKTPEAPRAATRRSTAEPEAEPALAYRQLLEATESREKKLIADLQSRHAAECSRLQEAFAADAKRLMAELEVKYEAIYGKLETSLAQKESSFVKALQAAAEREQELLGRLGGARRQMAVVVVMAIVSMAVILNYKGGPKDEVPAVLPSAPVSGLATLPQQVQETLPIASSVGVAFEPSVAVATLSAPAPVAVEKAAVKSETTAAKTGNGGNFSGGKVYSAK